MTSARFNAEEVFEIAIRMEENAAAFYRRAARLHPAPTEGGFLLELAEMEERHKRSFLQMQAGLAGHAGAGFDPQGEGALYLQAIAGGTGGEGAPAAAAALTGDESLAEILTTAVGLERQSILYYVGLKSAVVSDAAAAALEAIVAEEKSHVVTLAAHLRAIQDRSSP